MKYLEIIHVQASTGLERSAIRQLLNLTGQLLEFDRPPGLLAAEVYRHSFLAGDHILQLTWENSPARPTGSASGLRIKDTMKRYGLIDHHIWLAITGEDHG